MMNLPTPDVDEECFRENMRALRERKGWSQGELSRRLIEGGWPIFHQTTISRIESGDRPIKLGEARAIARALGSNVATMVSLPVETSIVQGLAGVIGDVRVARNRLSEAYGNLAETRAKLRELVEFVEPIDLNEWQDDDLREAFGKLREQAKQLLADVTAAPESVETPDEREGLPAGLRSRS
ncbi:transcriptional regulator with XRE-family HTH domain [Paenarthrobacter nicotinovorans]|uniref:helix-turn-helix domain-containing protein n=1 Tax=Micrococcaceae TaxID=1268 RepID=UPI000876725A|nr:MULTISPECIES: helix-turn-helix transcriptional regulator [Micrococcaceae]MDR6439082.1 transcriptional regulator with XRE-family HTH domain [Paenarthrobacter nicotinovorans]SCZ65300.1 Helix-turn-helix domain-containing protein [Arthrobacter sp. UNCCL28]